MARKPLLSISEKHAWTPDFFGPIFKTDSLTLKQALDLRNADEQIHRIAMFVPDEIIYGIDLSAKSLRSFRAVLMLVNIAGFSSLFKNYAYNENGGSLALTKMLSNYINIVVREIYCSEGDVLKFSAEGLLAVWKIPDGEFVFNTVQNAIIQAIQIQNSLAALKDINEISKVANIAISAGDVTFSVIGNDEARNFVIYGLPIEQLKQAKKISLPNDLVLSLSAWQHCTPSQYEYVIKDPYNVKIIKVLELKYRTSVSPSVHIDSSYETPTEEKSIRDSTRAQVISVNGKPYSETEIANAKKETFTAISTIAAMNPNFSAQLKSYLMKSVIQQIEKNTPLRFLAEIRQVTIISLDIIPNKCPVNELILLVDKCFLLVHSIVTQYAGCINMMNLYDKNIFFCIVFGICGDETDETCKNGINCAVHLLQTTKKTAGIQSTFIGISTGMAYCGVIGHIARKYYAIIGPPVNKAMKIADISHDKISCDYDTVLHSHFSKNQFRSRGVRTLRRLEKRHIYEYRGDEPIKKDLDPNSSLDYCYPILGRTDELECFNDILDEIGVAGRNYSGLLIEGSERIGKSRLLDAFVTSVCNRQIKPIKLSVHMTYASKAYSVLYHIILQILEAEDCEKVEEREKALLYRLGNILALKDFCYLNVLMRVQFPLSDAYCSDSDRQRHTKTISIFETILKQLKINICILLDDIQYMDYVSWQFLSSALNNENIVIAMTILKSNSQEDLFQIEAEIYKDKRLIKCTLPGLDLDLLPALACQFLNVFAIPRKLSRILQERKDGNIGWCEAVLTLILQSKGLDFIRVSPSEARRHDLVFPNGSLVTKLLIDLTPEELAPPLSWSQMNHLDICVTNENYSEISDINCDIKELMVEIYNRMNPYEQSFITCAATLGSVFKRDLIQNVMTNPISQHTIKTVAEMIRMRILECASLQRQDFHSEDLIFCVDKKRRTFSDMHHLLSCHCHHSQTVLNEKSSPLYAHCNILEFKATLFRKIVYDIQSNEEKQQHHTKAAKKYGWDARKCNLCGNGRFLRIPSKNTWTYVEEVPELSPSVSLIRHSILAIRNDKSTIKRESILPTKAIVAVKKPVKKPESIDICRVSIMPTYLDDDEDKVSTNREDEKNVHIEPRFWKRSTGIAPETAKDPSHSSYLEKFSHIDYRDCQCANVVGHLLWKLHEHIENSGEIDKVVLDFLMEYSAGLIQTAQPIYAIKLLSIAAERNEAAETEWMDDETETASNYITNKGIILALTGDAHSTLGDYDQAKKCYTAAVKLRGTLPKTKKATCYNIISKIYCKLQDSPYYPTSELSGQLAIKELELASYLRRLCHAFMIEDNLKTAQLFALRSFKLAFLSVDNFLEKGEIYLATIKVLHRTGNAGLTRCIERPMLIVIKMKTVWDDVEEIAMVANIYLMMYQTRALRGELEEAVDMGTKVLKISGTLHLNEVTLVTLPSLIQIMLWTKRINEAIDLMRELYFLADEDVDLSAKTWYYALSLEMILDAGVVVESYETSRNYYEKFISKRSKSYVWRDPQSLCRLLTCLWIYQLRIGYTTINVFAYSAEEYVKDVNYHDFSQTFSCSKGFERYLLMLLRCINMKHSNELLDLVQDVSKFVKYLRKVSSHVTVVKPRLYLLMAYLNILQGRKSTTQIYLRRAEKFGLSQGNKLMVAWIMQNKRTWKEKIYNNMAGYWSEYIGSADIVAWQHIHNFNIDTWSTILYPLPIPDAHL